MNFMKKCISSTNIFMIFFFLVHTLRDNTQNDPTCNDHENLCVNIDSKKCTPACSLKSPKLRFRCKFS